MTEPTTLHTCFAAQASRTPDAIALEWGVHRSTYRELDERTNQLAHLLRKAGVARGAMVGLYVDRSDAIVVGILGILKAGGAYVPCDPVYPMERVVGMLTDAGASVVVTVPELAAALPQGTAAVVVLEPAALAAQRTAPLPAIAEPDDLAYVIFTSGSTGRPKGVMVTHRNVMRLFTTSEPLFGFDANDRWTLFHSYAFDFTVWEIWGGLLYGGCVVVVPSEISWTPEGFHQLLVDKRITVLNQTPSYFQRVVQADLARPRSALSLRYVIFGGEALNPRTLAPWFERYGDAKPRLVNMYGITETTVHVTYRPLTEADAKSGSSVIGAPLPDLSVYLLGEDLKPVADGTEGEICVGGAGVSRGYINSAELTAARFVRDPFGSAPSARLYRSGDLGRRLPNGDIEYLGRADQQVKLRGYRIELGEIENALREHAAVKDVIVALREMPSGDRRLVAYVVPHKDAPPISELRALARRRIPEYMVPAAFVTIDAIPLTPNGKADRRALPPPPDTRPALAHAAVPARTEVEHTLVTIWEEELDVHPIGVTDDFFDLGGYSLVAVRVIGRVVKALDVKLSIAALVQHRTIEHLAEAIQPKYATQRMSQLVQLHAGKSRPLFLVHPIGGNVFCYVELARMLGEDQAVYGLQQRGLDGREAQQATIEEQAATLVEVVRSVQPHGPYLLAGWSYGGTVAYEIAQQLRAQGEDIALLGVIDSRAGTEETQSRVKLILRDYDPTVLSFWFTVIMQRVAGIETASQLEDFVGLDEAGRFARMFRELEPQAQNEEGLSQIKIAFGLFVGNLRALNTYRTPRAEKMTLFRAGVAVEQLPNRPTPPPWAWERYCDDIESFVLPTTHFTMLHPDNVRHLAEPLRAVIERAHRASPPRR